MRTSHLRVEVKQSRWDTVDGREASATCAHSMKLSSRRTKARAQKLGSSLPRDQRETIVVVLPTTESDLLSGPRSDKLYAPTANIPRFAPEDYSTRYIPLAEVIDSTRQLLKLSLPHRPSLPKQQYFSAGRHCRCHARHHLGATFSLVVMYVLPRQMIHTYTDRCSCEQFLGQG